MKEIRVGVYGILKYEDKIIVIQKGRGPFTGLYDLPGGKIEHSENHIESLKRELFEETGLQESDYKIDKLITVEEDFVKHIWNGIEKDQHIIAIIYEVIILKEKLDLNYIEKLGDSNGLKLIKFDDLDLPMTNILQAVIKKKYKII